MARLVDGEVSEGSDRRCSPLSGTRASPLVILAESQQHAKTPTEQLAERLLILSPHRYEDAKPGKKRQDVGPIAESLPQTSVVSLRPEATSLRQLGSDPRPVRCAPPDTSGCG